MFEEVFELKMALSPSSHREAMFKSYVEMSKAGLSYSLVEKEVQNALDLIEDLPEFYDRCAEIASAEAIDDPEWLKIAGKSKMYAHSLRTPEKFSEVTEILRPRLGERYYNFVMENAAALDRLVCGERDYMFDIFGMETLIKSYLARISVGGKMQIVERPQHMYLRVATFLWMPEGDSPSRPHSASEGDSLTKSLRMIETVYTSLSTHLYTHASPTLFNAGFKDPQMASCFTLTIEDNMESITDSWRKIALISAKSGGIGCDFSSLRHSEISGAGSSSGVGGWLRIADTIVDVVDQGGKRKGAGTAYLNDWHIDIESYVRLRRQSGSEDLRLAHLFLGLMISDEFMRRVKSDGDWTLFCPNKLRGLERLWGLEFEVAYHTAEERARRGDHTLQPFKIIKARDLWNQIIVSQIETGMPFMLYVDAINRKSNQTNPSQKMKKIRLSNLCTEITLFTDEKNIGTCNLASIALNKFVKVSSHPALLTPQVYYDFEGLEVVVRELVRNLNQVIDRNYDPQAIPEIGLTNKRNRPLGIGVQGLADTFALMDMTWTQHSTTGTHPGAGSSAGARLGSPDDSDDPSRTLNTLIFETIYYAAVSESVMCAKESGPYETFPGSHTSRGLFQFDLWDLEAYEKKSRRGEACEVVDVNNSAEVKRGRYDWNSLREEMKTHGLRNSLLIALMPTASTSNILGNNECIEPYGPIVGARTVLSGQYVKYNLHAYADLQKIGVWDLVKEKLWTNGGTLATISPDEVPEEVRERYTFLQSKHRTVYEIPQKRLLQLEADRGRYVCQSASHNCFMKEVKGSSDKDNIGNKLTSYHFTGWELGIKTGMYYFRQPSPVTPIVMRHSSAKKTVKRDSTNDSDSTKRVECTDEVCVVCSS